MIKEMHIAESVISWLEEQHWEVYQEVQFRSYSGIADIVAKNGHLLWIIECKRSLSLSVMAQARAWRSHFRSIAVPQARRPSRWERQLAYDIAKDYLRIGVITVNGSYVSQPVAPPLMREHHRFAKEKIPMLSEAHKHYAKAGSQRGGHYTPYKSTIESCHRFIKSNPGCTMKELIDGIKTHHYANDRSAYGTLLKNFRTIEADWVKLDDSERPFRIYLRDGFDKRES